MSIVRVMALATVVGLAGLGVVVPATQAVSANRPGAGRQAPKKAAVKATTVPSRIPAPAVAGNTAAQPALIPGQGVRTSQAMTRTANGRPNRTAGPVVPFTRSADIRQGVQPNPVERPIVPVRTRQVPVRQAPQPVR